MTEEEFLIDTIQYYHNNPTHRCTNNIGGCWYSTENIYQPNVENINGGSGCAIGRVCTPENRLALDSTEGDGDTDIISIISGAQSLLPDWMTIMSPSFLGKIQGLHDSNSYWNSRGITEAGKEYVKQVFDYKVLDQINL